MITYTCTNKFPARAGKVKFGLLSKKDTIDLSVVEIKDNTIYYRGLPNPFGVNDHRMGSVDRRLLCGTCCKNVKDCQGHSGHIELNYPMYHVGFFDTTFKTLKSVCYLCSRVLIAEEERESHNLSGKAAFLYVYSIARNKRKCPFCGLLQPNYAKTSLSIKTEWQDSVPSSQDENGCSAPLSSVWESEEEKAYCTRPFTSKEAMSILRNIPKDDLSYMGFSLDSHPENMILTAILVPPPNVRPAIMVSEGSRSRGQDDATHKIQDIMKRNLDMLSCKEFSSDFQEKLSRLQFEIFTYMNNSIRGQKQSTQRSGMPTKCLMQRLKGKEGRIRGNLMGKRCDFSARTVITPDTNMDIDEVGIPESVAVCLTVPETVTEHNIHSLAKRVVNGPNRMDGAENIITSQGMMISLSLCENRSRIRLQYGWVIERYLQDNDVVIFNRQPSLHKMGMMGHRVKIMKNNSFRLNLCCANPYNADFDGDEMNLHVPQSPSAISDVASLMMVPMQLISPQANRPVMGIVQDTLLGAHLLSDNVFMDRKKACHILSHLRHGDHSLPPPCVCKPKQMWSGKQILECLFPPDFDYGSSSRNHAEDDKTPLFRRGKFLLGKLSKANIGSASGGFIHVLQHKKGNVFTTKWMSDIQRIVNSWLLFEGFSVGIDDCVMTKKGTERVHSRLDKVIGHVQSLVEENTSMSKEEKQILESTVSRILSNLLSQTGSIVDEELSKENSIRKMVVAGSKGNPINLSQICGCVGQQSIEGQRIKAEKGNRTLSFYKQNDVNLEGRGFVRRSYAEGLDACEYFFHAMGGREGLVDTAVKTATTGYIQRRQIKSMEDSKVSYDGTVRTSDEKIVDFSYGGDGMDPSKLCRISLKSLGGNYDFSLHPDWEKEEMLSCVSRICLKGDKVLLSFMPSLLLKLKDEEEGREERKKVFLDETSCSLFLRKLLSFSKMPAIRLSILETLGKGTLLSKPVSQAKAIFTFLRSKILFSKVQAGEMVGSIAAQSIGEPCTQLTLNSFHQAGVGSRAVTLGIPRLKELLDQSKSIKTPSNAIYMKSLFSRNERLAHYLSMTIPLVRLSDVVKQCEILLDPDVLCTVIEKDKEMVELDSLFGNPPPQSTSSSFVARLILNKSFMKFRHITVVMIRTLLGKRLSSKAHVISSEDNSLEWVVRIRYKRMKEVVSSFDDPSQEDFVCHRITTALMDTVAISGHLQISSASVREEEGQFIVDTLGCNLVDLSAMDCVDWNNCYTNDVNEAHSVLGLEAAVSVLFNELETTISYDGTYVDPRHLMMIVNTMTRGGYIMPLSRHGINRIDTGPLLRCSFEETPDILCDAACFAESDNGNGISQNIMTGKLPSIGSGLPLVASSVDHLHPRCLLEKDAASSCIECSDEIYPIFSDSSDDPFSSSMMMLPDSDTDIAPPQSDYFPPPVQEYRPSSPCMMD